MKIRKLIIIVGVFMFALLVFGWFWLPGARHQARAKATLMTLQVVATTSRYYFDNCGVWPSSIAELTTTNNPKQAIFLSVGSPPLKDAWGRPLTYIPFNATNGSGAVQSHTRDLDGREVVYEVKFGP